MPPIDRDAKIQPVPSAEGVLKTTPAPSPAVAPPPGNPRFALFDSLRGLAALAIVVFHVFTITLALDTPVLGDVVTVLGPRSLTVFFVISGFLLYRPYAAALAKGRRPPRTKTYLRRRVFRIVPAYWVALTVLGIFPGLTGVLTEDWWRYYFFLQLYSRETLGGGIPVAWSLCVEVTFYLLLPVWALGIRTLAARTRLALPLGELVPLAAVMAFGALVQIAQARGHVSDLVSSSLLGQCTWIALGMVLAVLSVHAHSLAHGPAVVRFVSAHPGICWLGAAACLAGLIAVTDPSGLTGIIQAIATAQPIGEAVATVALTAAMVTLIVLPAVFGEDAGGAPRRLLALAPVAWVGLVSYGIFLWHLPVAEFLGFGEALQFSATGLDLADRVHTLTTLVLLTCTLAVTLAFAALSYYVVELPFLRRKER